MKRIVSSSFVAALLFLPACGAKEEATAKPQKAPNPWADLNYEYAVLPGTSTYPLKTCCVCDKPLGTSPVCVGYKAYEARVCDMDCLKKFDKDPEGIIRTKINPRAMFDK